MSHRHSLNQKEARRKARQRSEVTRRVTRGPAYTVAMRHRIASQLKQLVALAATEETATE